MKQSTKYLGLLAASSTIAFLYFYSKDKGETLGEQEGINIQVDPEKVLKSKLDKLSPYQQNLVISMAKKGLMKILE